MANFKKDILGQTELLQVRVSPLLKKSINQYIHKEKEKGLKYNQSDFLRDAITAKLSGEFVNVEKQIAKGHLLANWIETEIKKGKPGQDVLESFYELFYSKDLWDNFAKKVIERIEQKLAEQGIKINLQVEDK